MLRSSYQQLRQSGVCEAEALAQAEELARNPYEAATSSAMFRVGTTGRNSRSIGGALSFEEAEGLLEWDHDQGFTTDNEYVTELNTLSKTYTAAKRAGLNETDAIDKAEKAARAETSKPNTRGAAMAKALEDDLDRIQFMSGRG